MGAGDDTNHAGGSGYKSLLASMSAKYCAYSSSLYSRSTICPVSTLMPEIIGRVIYACLTP